jgi:hypothetical protein
MPEDLNFNFPIATLLRDGDAITTAAETRVEVHPRLPAGHVAATRALLTTVSSDDAAAKGKKGGVGTLTQEQDDKFRELNAWIARARKTAGLAFKGQDVKLHEEFQVGVNSPSDLGSVLQRARIIIAAIKVAGNDAALKAKGWIDADTAALEAVVTALASVDTTQETGKGGAKEATGVRNRNANELYVKLQTIQNAAGLQWPEDGAVNAGIRDEFRLNTFPPRGGSGKDKPVPTPPAPPAPPA